ncbi:hypothetical protein Ddye_007143 [Dipteronia dyeriana]|uniref:Uncharacterized protein n=1 Tax=Dipteronia dyeriana TaxID=168575 RepID=A0AAE0CR70_9ROSI|nr:hypothetical protein Ddye_007143 [Dipteronia dyeriana]
MSFGSGSERPTAYDIGHGLFGPRYVLPLKCLNIALQLHCDFFRTILKESKLECQEYGTDSDDEYDGYIAEEAEALVWQRS